MACVPCADEPMQTCRKIVNWRQHLRFPEEVAVPPLARDLICRLLCDVEQRLGSHGGAAEIRVSPAKYTQAAQPSPLNPRPRCNRRLPLSRTTCKLCTALFDSLVWSLIKLFSQPITEEAVTAAVWPHRRTRSSTAWTGSACTASGRRTRRWSPTSWTPATLRTSRCGGFLVFLPMCWPAALEAEDTGFAVQRQQQQQPQEAVVLFEGLQCRLLPQNPNEGSL